MELPSLSEAQVAAMVADADDFASFPGTHNDASVKAFLDRFPLPMLFAALKTNEDAPAVEDTIVACLDKVFSSKYGASLLTNYMLFIQVGLQAQSQAIKSLSCKAVFYLLENVEDKEAAAEILAQHNLYSLLLNCLVNGDMQTVKVSMDAIISLAQTSKGYAIIFPANGQGSMQLKELATHSSSVVRIRALALIAKLFAASGDLATAIHNNKLLGLYEEELRVNRDMLETLSILEVLFELVISPHASSLLLKTSLLQLLTDLISNPGTDPLLQSRAALIGGRLLSSDDAYITIHESCVLTFLSTIDGMLRLQKEVESFMEALGLIGTTKCGAQLLLIESTNIVRHLLESAFGRLSRGKQLAALDALGSISGADRPREKIILDDQAEEYLKQLIYNTASSSTKLTPSGLLLSVLQQDLEIRIAGYRLISGLILRKWCLMEVCSNSEIISLVTAPTTENTKKGMDARHECCTAISTALSTSPLGQDASVAKVAEKLLEAVRRGPYLAKRHIEAQPVVGTAERF